MKPRAKETATKKKAVPIKAKAKTAERTPDWKRATRSLKAKPGDERKAALERLGVTAEQVEQAMPMSYMLSFAEGGIPQVINAMKLAQQGDPLIPQFLAKWNSLSEHDRQRLPFEAVAISANLYPPHVFGSIMAALQAYNVAVVKIMTMTSHHKLIASRIKYGQLPGGDKDRLAMDTAMGFLPSAKGPTFIGKAIFGSGKAVMGKQRLDNGADDDEDDESPIAAADIDLDRLFPAPRDMQEKLTAIRQRQLPEPKKESKKPN
jgi:hypothetical protein